ncbi:hypothetical protein [Teichococcus vastitatis]|uniref:Uncharacterized protein n=1 Tax=Teichococcus vastitatis TaxID=2307076 RepID=A0ABS9W6W9_9PROT|nr:hypothetical protein [Pseudoroseomonas vastitatis]MCI0755026.1 hypothetical protein [Pseudoroseomonas vastitatis]
MSLVRLFAYAAAWISLIACTVVISMLALEETKQRQQDRAAFDASCQATMTRYECLALWRNGTGRATAPRIFTNASY